MNQLICENNKMDERRCGEIVTEIKTIQKSTMRTVLYASVDIGRLLCEAKDKLPHGAWGRWLDENFSYSQTTANNLMRLYTNYGERDQVDLFFEGEDKMALFGNLTPSQALALLPLPIEERKGFVQTHDMENTSVRDIEEEIRARKEAEERAGRLEQLFEELKEEKNDAQDELDGIKEEYEQKIEELDAAHKDKIKKLEEALKEAQDPKSLKEKKKEMQAKIEEKVRKETAEERKKLEEELLEAQKTAGEVEKRLEAAEKRARDKAAAEYMGKLLELENRAQEAEQRATGIGSSAAVQKFAVHFENFQREWKEMKSLVNQIDDAGDAETAGKLMSAMIRVLQEINER